MTTDLKTLRQTLREGCAAVIQTSKELPKSGDGLSDKQEREAVDNYNDAYDLYLSAANPENILRLLDALEEAEKALDAPTHAINDHNCENWPPGQGCQGCAGDERRKEALSKLRGGR